MLVTGGTVPFLTVMGFFSLCIPFVCRHVYWKLDQLYTLFSF